MICKTWGILGYVSISPSFLCIVTYKPFQIPKATKHFWAYLHINFDHLPVTSLRVLTAMWRLWRSGPPRSLPSASLVSGAQMDRRSSRWSLTERGTEPEMAMMESPSSRLRYHLYPFVMYIIYIRVPYKSKTEVFLGFAQIPGVYTQNPRFSKTW
jgi:hypothetical protein